MINVDLEAKTIDRDELSDMGVYNALNKMNIEGGNPITRTTRRLIKTGNVSVTIEYFELDKSWSFIDD